MTSLPDDQRLIQSYVRDKYFVSTILRRSSAMLAPGPYYETMVWTWNPETKERGEIVEQSESGWAPKLALMDHASVCERLTMSVPEPTLAEVEAHGY